MSGMQDEKEVSIREVLQDGEVNRKRGARDSMYAPPTKKVKGNEEAGHVE